MQIKTLFMMNIVCVIFVFSTASWAASDRPNVLLIMSDDLNNDIGAYGHPLVKTPRIDRLAQEGLLFDRAYCQMPLCGPSRSSMLLSLYVEQTGIYGNGTPIRDRFEEIVTLPELFRTNGYYTARIGKIFHYGVPKHIGTDGLDDPQSWDYVYNPIGRDRTEEDDIFTLIPGKFGATLSWRAIEGGDAEHTDGRGALEAVRILEEQAESGEDSPFFLAFGMYRPHTPFVAPKKYFDMYPLDDIVVPPVQIPREPFAAFQKARAEEDAMSDTLRRRAIQAYYASVSFMDAQVGRVLDALDRLDLAKDTIVIFTSDHGYHLGEHGLWQKRSLFEGVARVPLILRVPGMKTKGKRTDQLAELVDVYPTLASLCGLTAPTHVEGKDISGLVDDAAAFTKSIALTQEMRNYRENEKAIRYKGFSIRTDQYRYTEWDDGKHGVELYDHRADPGEMHNLAKDNGNAKLVKKMHSMMAQHLNEIRAKNLSAWE